jgi:GT2 family glycosyltransferase
MGIFRNAYLFINLFVHRHRFMKSIWPVISIIILNHNGMKYIQQCIESVLKSEYDNFELLVVDNDSTDKSLDIIKTEFNDDDRIKVIRSNKNLGFAAGNNIGARHAKGDYIVLLNIDTLVHPKWLRELITVMECDPAIGVAQPKLLLLDNKSLFDSAGDYLDFYGFSFRRGGEWLEKDVGQYDTIHDIFSARGAALVTRKEIVQQIGLFDDDYFLDFEDIDFCWRVRLYGKRVVFVPNSIVYHKGAGISSQASFDIKGIHPSKNIVMTIIKNYNTINMVKYGIAIHILSFFTGFFIIEQFILRRDHKLMRIRHRVQAYIWLVRNIKKLQAKRRCIQNDIRKVSDSEIMKYMLKTSIWDIGIHIINVIKLGRLKSEMLYFNDHIQDI